MNQKTYFFASITISSTWSSCPFHITNHYQISIHTKGVKFFFEDCQKKISEYSKQQKKDKRFALNRVRGFNYVFTFNYFFFCNNVCYLVYVCVWWCFRVQRLNWIFKMFIFDSCIFVCVVIVGFYVTFDGWLLDSIFCSQFYTILFYSDTLWFFSKCFCVIITSIDINWEGECLNLNYFW